MLPDGAIKFTVECISRRRFKNNYIGLFWASYIHRPERDRVEPNAASRENGWRGRLLF
jgi:hypothetical protein